MNKNIFKPISRIALYSIIGAFILFLMALTIKHFTNYELNNILFVEGLIFLMITLFSTISGNPMGLSMQSLGQANAQYNANANLQVEKIEEKNDKKIDINIDIITVALILGAIIIIVTSFII